MIIETKELGYVQVEEHNIITFPYGIYGFEDAEHFAILRDETKNDNPFMWLQCTDNKNPCFAVVDAQSFFSDYAPVLNDEDKLAISTTSDQYLRYLIMATVPGDLNDLSFNLKCPIVINSEKNIAMQIILDNSDYPMKYYILKNSND